MGLKNYGVIKGAVHDYKDTREKNHFQIVIQTGDRLTDCFRVAVNVRSSESNSPDLLYNLDDDFQHPVTEKIRQFNRGYTKLQNNANSGAVDYIRLNMFDILQMQMIPSSLPGPDNDLSELLEFWVKKAKNEQAEIYAFGEKWPSTSSPDKYFSNIPDQGIHDIHMNQGNPHPGKFSNDNGVWQDGCLFFNFIQSGKWTALFLRFQTQSIHTDDITGHPLDTPEPAEPIYIIAALVNPEGEDAGREKVILFNPNEREMDIDGWSILDASKRKELLSGKIKSGDIARISLSGNSALLGNNGGIITLLNREGIKIDGVNYTKKQAKQSGKWIKF